MADETSGRETELYEALRAAGDPQAIVALAQRAPAMLGDAFLSLLEGWIGEAEAGGNTNAATGLRQRQAVLLELRRRREQETQLPPLSRALMAFIRADDEQGALEVYERDRRLLDTAEAQAALEQSFKSDDAKGQERIAERTALLRRLRGGA